MLDILAVFALLLANIVITMLFFAVTRRHDLWKPRSTHAKATPGAGEGHNKEAKGYVLSDNMPF